MNSEQPSPAELVATLVNLLDVQRIDDDLFEGGRAFKGSGRLFGGQVIAQALMAATNTVGEDRVAHSLHAYFLRPGSEELDIQFRVERDFNGGSFANRRVIAMQRGRPILNLAASFHKIEPGASHQDVMPDVPPPEEMESDDLARDRYAHLIPEDRRAGFLAHRPIELRTAGGRHWMNPEPSAPLGFCWMRAIAPMPDDPRLHRAALAYASDYVLLGTATRPHGLSWVKGNIQDASLDHAVWLHDDFRMDDWLLYATDSPWAGRARGFNRGRIFTRDGRLVASTAQEGLIRMKVAKG